MAKDMEIAWLFDFYGDMLTEKQQQVVELYYDEDLSLAEIAENQNITRQGVRDNIKRSEEKLFELEEKLGLFKRFVQLENGLDKIASLSEQIYKNSADETTKKLALEINRTAGTLKE